MTPPTVRPLSPDEWRVYRDLRLGALAESPHAFGSLLEFEKPRPDEEWAARLAAGVGSTSDLPLVAAVGGAPAGLAWGRADPEDRETIHVFQMWVAPRHRGGGVGALLLETVVAWARGLGCRQVILDVTCGNNAAFRLYARAGFVAVGDPEPLRPGSDLDSQRMQLSL